MTVISEKALNPLAALYEGMERDIENMQNDRANCKLFEKKMKLALFGMQINPPLIGVLLSHCAQLINIHYSGTGHLHDTNCESWKEQAAPSE
jgi:hypothetical protein